MKQTDATKFSDNALINQMQLKEHEMLASLIGAITTKQTGGSAIKGALAGKAAVTGLRLLGPVFGTAALGFAAYKGWQKYQNQTETSENENNEIVTDDNAAALGSAAITKRQAA